MFLIYTPDNLFYLTEEDASFFVSTEQPVKLTAEKYFNEINRTMKSIWWTLFVRNLTTGTYFKIYFGYCRDAENANREKNAYNPESITMPIFLVLATKFKRLPTPFTIFLNVLLADYLRLHTVEELMNAVVSIQKAALVCNGLARNSIAGHNEITMDLCKLGEDLPRFTLHILDQPPTRGLGRYAAFITPQGREVDWLFATPEGRKKLLASTNYQRLVVVLLHRDQEYKSLDAVKAELADSIKNLAPFGLTDPIPFLSLGSDVGKRETLVCASSKIFCDFRVEEVEGSSGKLFRRLIFLNNQSVIQ
uniref:Uncharacterized protein n=1 Tax=Glossina morsitans morsitans TaxID=37546 RepID=A0A1B0FNL3_GLOMM